jgi:hypothetical protein
LKLPFKIIIIVSGSWKYHGFANLCDISEAFQIKLNCFFLWDKYNQTLIILSMHTATYRHKLGTNLIIPAFRDFP